jgi:prophage maintenance system killer protein
MSGEQLSVERSLKTTKNSFHISKARKSKKISGRVDINHLMSKVRNEQKKQRNENLIFFGLVSSVVVITGIIASL